jgi:hypothetical protein
VDSNGDHVLLAWPGYTGTTNLEKKNQGPFFWQQLRFSGIFLIDQPHGRLTVASKSPSGSTHGLACRCFQQAIHAATSKTIG